MGVLDDILNDGKRESKRHKCKPLIMPVPRFKPDTPGNRDIWSEEIPNGEVRDFFQGVDPDAGSIEVFVSMTGVTIIGTTRTGHDTFTRKTLGDFPAEWKRLNPKGDDWWYQNTVMLPVSPNEVWEWPIRVYVKSGEHHEHAFQTYAGLVNPEYGEKLAKALEKVRDSMEDANTDSD